MSLTTSMAGGLMEAERPFRKFESFGWDNDERRERAAARSLAISTVTVHHQNRFRCGFVSNRAASASATERRRYSGHIYLVF
jgi:hypothetical protein